MRRQPGAVRARSSRRPERKARRREGPPRVTTSRPICGPNRSEPKPQPPPLQKTRAAQTITRLPTLRRLREGRHGKRQTLGAVWPTQGPESRTSIPGRLTDLSTPVEFTEKKLRGQSVTTTTRNRNCSHPRLRRRRSFSCSPTRQRSRVYAEEIVPGGKSEFCSSR